MLKNVAGLRAAIATSSFPSVPQYILLPTFLVPAFATPPTVPSSSQKRWKNTGNVRQAKRSFVTAHTSDQYAQVALYPQARVRVDEYGAELEEDSLRSDNDSNDLWSRRSRAIAPSTSARAEMQEREVDLKGKGKARAFELQHGQDLRHVTEQEMPPEARPIPAQDCEVSHLLSCTKGGNVSNLPATHSCQAEAPTLDTETRSQADVRSRQEAQAHISKMTALAILIKSHTTRGDLSTGERAYTALLEQYQAFDHSTSALKRDTLSMGVIKAESRREYIRTQAFLFKLHQACFIRIFSAHLNARDIGSATALVRETLASLGARYIPPRIITRLVTASCAPQFSTPEHRNTGRYMPTTHVSWTIVKESLDLARLWASETSTSQPSAVPRKADSTDFDVARRRQVLSAEASREKLAQGVVLALYAQPVQRAQATLLMDRFFRLEEQKAISRIPNNAEETIGVALQTMLKLDTEVSYRKWFARIEHYAQIHRAKLRLASDDHAGHTRQTEWQRVRPLLRRMCIEADTISGWKRSRRGAYNRRAGKSVQRGLDTDGVGSARDDMDSTRRKVEDPE